MNLRGIANGLTRSINPNITVSLRASAGYTSGPGYKQAPAYAAAIIGPGQLQAMGYKDLMQVEGLNIQNVVKALYLYGSVSGVVRPDGKGGDLIEIASQTGVGPQDVGEWLVVKVLENWPDWTKVAITKQGGA